MKRVFLCTLLTLAVIYIVPFLVYSLFTVFTDLKSPQGVSPTQFLISILISKIGVAIAFVLIFYYARKAWRGQWLRYAFLWWLMFVTGEVGQAVGPDYTSKEAIAGIISETIYFPISAYIVNRWVVN